MTLEAYLSVERASKSFLNS